MHWIRRHRRGRPPHPDVLTPAEWRVLEHVREGRPNAEIAVRLGLSVTTVKTHVSSILAKTGASDRRALAEWEGRPASVERRAARALALPLLGRGTKEALVSTMKFAGLAAGGLVAVAAVAVGIVVISDGGEADDGVVAVIEGIDVTEEEWDRGVAASDWGRECTREQLARTDVVLPEAERMRLQRLSELYSRHSTEAVALGLAILANSAKAEADVRGLEPDEEQVAAAVSQHREVVERALEGTYDERLLCLGRQFEAEIARFGADRYWDEIVPGQQRRSLLLQNLWRAEGVMPPYGGEYGFDLARSADVNVGQQVHGSVTLDEAHAFLDDLERLMGSQPAG